MQGFYKQFTERTWLTADAETVVSGPWRSVQRIVVVVVIEEAIQCGHPRGYRKLDYDNDNDRV